MLFSVFQESRNEYKVFDREINDFSFTDDHNRVINGFSYAAAITLPGILVKGS
jgi:hypothetical protein